jgi:hypothetical protein
MCGQDIATSPLGIGPTSALDNNDRRCPCNPPSSSHARLRNCPVGPTVKAKDHGRCAASGDGLMSARSTLGRGWGVCRFANGLLTATRGNERQPAARSGGVAYGSAARCRYLPLVAGRCLLGDGSSSPPSDTRVTPQSPSKRCLRVSTPRASETPRPFCRPRTGRETSRNNAN